MSKPQPLKDKRRLLTDTFEDNSQFLAYKHEDISSAIRLLRQKDARTWKKFNNKKINIAHLYIELINNKNEAFEDVIK